MYSPTLILPTNPDFPPVINCCCSSDQALCLYTRPCLWSSEGQTASSPPSLLCHFLSLHWIIHTDSQTYFVSSTSRKRKKTLGTLVPFSSFSPVLLLCRKFLKTAVYTLSCLSSHFSQIHSSQDFAPAPPHTCFVKITSAFLTAKSSGQCAVPLISLVLRSM